MLKIIPNLTVWTDEPDLADPFACDEFRMYEFKVRRCARGRAHDWTDCPYAHPGEKARRRDPRRFHYSGAPCPDFKKGTCDRGDACELAHGVFECWLHPARYRTQPCKDGTACRRRVCFFVHTPDQLRVLSPRSAKMAAPDGYDGSPISMKMKNNSGGFMLGSSPTGILSPTSYSEEGSGSYSSPPVSPDGGLLMVMRRMNLCGGGGWGLGLGFGFGGSLPSTPRAKRMVGFEEENDEGFDGIDVGWISELVK